MNSLDPSCFSPIQKKREQSEEIMQPLLSYQGDVWKRLRQNKVAITGLLFLFILTFFAICWPYLSSYTYYETNLALKNHPPSLRYWFGTDDLGRDIFIRTCWGARISLFIGITAATIDLAIGVLWGGLAAHVGGKVDALLMRVADILYALPYLLVVIMLMVVMGSGLIPIIVALTFTGWIGMARIVRGQILQLKQQEYILAAIALGAGSGRVLFKHLIPNAMGPIIVTMTFTIPVAIFTEAFLSFLGLGVQAPMASWGTMASDGLPAMRYYPWRLFFPALLISFTMLALNLVGDGLRDAIDPKLRK